MIESVEALLKKLIAFQTITPDQAENQRALDWVESQLKTYLRVQRRISHGFPSLVAATHRTKNPKLWLAAHMDVVPGSPGLFRLKKEKGKWIGRGVYDMKFAIACYLRLVQELKQGVQNYNFGILLTSDEEIGGENGVKFLLQEGYRGNLVFLPDGGENWEFEEAAKGVWHLEVTAHGKSNHGSRPWEGINAIQLLINFLNDLTKLFPKEPCHDPAHYHDTISVGRMGGGGATNQIPDRATAWVDIRHVVETSKRALEENIHTLLKSHPAIRIAQITYGSAYRNRIARPEIKLFHKLAKERYGIEMKPRISHGSSDAHYFGEKKIPVLATVPKGGGHHSEHEWVDAHDLERFYQVMKEWVLGIT